ncbi:hypothetical protein [Streptomyces sp. NPDC005533]|uniref:hypothetical protein n=1 Tax=Streptomyces sp. NPDC005533 TaxID=3364723 RepID=UPI003681934D
MAVADRGVTDLIAAYQEDRWVPCRDELEFAAGPVCQGRLTRVRGSAYLLLRHVAADDSALHTVRRLIDILATTAEQPPDEPLNDTG